jgi:hypothetical protein
MLSAFTPSVVYLFSLHRMHIANNTLLSWPGEVGIERVRIRGTQYGFDVSASLDLFQKHIYIRQQTRLG